MLVGKRKQQRREQASSHEVQAAEKVLLETYALLDRLYARCCGQSSMHLQANDVKLMLDNNACMYSMETGLHWHHESPHH